LSLSNQISGGNIPDLYLALFDKYGQIIGIDSDSTATLEINKTGAPTTYTPILEGILTVTSLNGMFSFQDISFTAQPNYSYSMLIILSIIDLYFTTDGIDESKPSNQQYMTDTGQSSLQMDLSISLRS
jgi:hypothetical protein